VVLKRQEEIAGRYLQETNAVDVISDEALDDHDNNNDDDDDDDEEEDSTIDRDYARMDVE
jgi:hypothetical protein